MFNFRFRRSAAAIRLSDQLQQRRAKALAAASKPVIEGLEERSMFSFTPGAVLPTGMAVTAMATADFNGDGLADIVTVGSVSGRGIAAVQLNHGDGTYGAAIVEPTNNNPVEVKVGDFDGDGHPDIVTLASYYTGALTELHGNGDGTFAAPTPYTVSTPPTSITVADVNGDGKPDLIAGNHYFNSVSVFKNNGLGTLGPKVDYTAGGSPASVAVGDFNNDGLADILSTNQNTPGSITLHLGNGDGTFQAARSTPASTAPFATAIADFNGDGNLDVAIANSFGANTISVMYGNGDATFKAPQVMAIGSQPLDIQKGDFNGDGKMDLVERTGSGFTVELNNGDGTFAAAVPVYAANGNDMVVADFNNDGFADVALSSSTGLVSTYTNDLGAIDNPQNVATLVISAPATSLSGNAVPVTVSAVDSSGNPITDYAGTVNIFSTDPAGSVLTYTFTAADAGTHTFTTGVSLVTVGPQSIIASASLAGSASTSVQVQAAPASRFTIGLPDEPSDAGTVMPITVTALDSSNNMGATYQGTVHFTSSDPTAILPADYTYTAADAGTHTFNVTIRTAGLQTITATDTVATGVHGTSNPVLIKPGEVSTMLVTGGSGSIGKFRQVTVDAEDSFGNKLPGAAQRTIHFSSSDPNAVLPADVTLVNGEATVMVKFMTTGPQTLTATDMADPTMTGSETVSATAADVGSFVVTGFPATTAGTAKTFTVSAFDILGNPMANYTGTVTFGSSDWQASLPASYTFTAADKGVHTFTATLRTAGSQSIRVSEALFGSTGTQSGISVAAGTVTAISSTGPQHVVAGTPFAMVVTARDAFGNLATNFTDKVRFTATDAKAAASDGLHVHSRRRRHAHVHDHAQDGNIENRLRVCHRGGRVQVHRHHDHRRYRSGERRRFALHARRADKHHGRDCVHREAERV